MKASHVLIAAAKAMEDGKWDFGCLAIRYTPLRGVPALNCYTAPVPSRSSALDYFRRLRPRTFGNVWFGDPTPRNRDRRILALCFAAAIAESEGN